MALLTNFLIKWRYHIIFLYIQGKVLDIGCGDGGICALFKNNIQSYYGIDCNSDKIAQLKVQTGNTNFFVATLIQNRLPLRKSLTLL